MSPLVFTIVTRNRLHLARTLMHSVAKAFPAAQRHVLVIDPAGGQFNPATEDFHVTFGDDLSLPDYSSYAFVNDALGLCCLLKPVFALHLLQRTTVDMLIYADADMQCYGTPSALLQMLEASPIVLTPHVLAPLPENSPRNDSHIMRSGAFNAGLFAVSRHTMATTFLEWWLGCMQRDRQLDAVFCHDQQYLALAPVYFPRTAVLRDPGCNVAYWNLTERPLARDTSGRLTAADVPVSFFHYSFFDPSTPDLLANRPPVVVPAHDPLLRSLLAEYAADLSRNGATDCAHWGYAYATFADGKPIRQVHRSYYLERTWTELGRTGSPFDPDFETKGCRGLKAVYAVDESLPRLIRWMRRGFRRLRPQIL